MRWTPKKQEPYKLWFAWYPVFCKREGVYVWLEHTERREVGTDGYFFWEYNAVDHK